MGKRRIILRNMASGIAVSVDDEMYIDGKWCHNTSVPVRVYSKSFGEARVVYSEASRTNITHDYPDELRGVNILAVTGGTRGLSEAVRDGAVKYAISLVEHLRKIGRDCEFVDETWKAIK